MSDEYIDAWESTRILTVQEGNSWSGNENNHLFLNLGGMRFADVSQLSGCDCVGDGRAVATLDWDDDGRIDFLLKNRTGPRLQLLRNVYPGGGAFLAVELRGNGTTSNRDAIGARVNVDLGDRIVARTLYAGDGFLAQSSKRLHFGLGDAASVTRLTVRWPDGTADVFRDLSVNARYRIVQGAAAAELLPARTIAALAQVEPLELEPATPKTWRIVLGFELPMAAVPVPTLEADANTPLRRVRDLAGSPVLLNVWRTECSACLREFHDFKRHRDDIAASGVRLVTINGDGPDQIESAKEMLRWYRLQDTEPGYRSAALASAIEILYKEVAGPRTNREMVSPTSFLLDPEGRLVVMYLGPVDIDVLIEDAGEIMRDDPRPVLDRLNRGRRILYNRRDFAELAHNFDAAGLPDLADYYRQIDEETLGYFFQNGRKHWLPKASER